MKKDPKYISYIMELEVRNSCLKGDK
jgi:hypothetical protein